MKKLLASFLTIIVLLTCTTSAFAIDAHDHADEQKLEAEISYDESAIRVRELLEERNYDTKAYLMSDDTVEYEFYAGDVHYQLDDGTWNEIDNTIVKINGGADGYLYKNAAGAVDVRFGDIADQGILISKGDHSIRLIMDDIALDIPKLQSKSAMESEMKISSSSKKLAKSDASEIFDVPEEAITYKTEDEEIGFIYSVDNDRVKESIILQSYEGVNEFVFTLHLANLSMQNQNGELVFIDDSGKMIFFLERPYVIDSNGEYSFDVHYEIVDNNGEQVTLKTVVSEEFLTSPTTAYPVLIDPTFAGVTTTRDTFVACLCANPLSCSCSMGLRNFNTSAEGSNRYYLRTGKDSSYGVRRSYINFDGLHSAIKGKQVMSARLELYVDSYAGLISVYAQDVSSSWYNASTTMNWRTKAPTTISYQSNIGAQRGNWYTIDVTNMANGRWRNLSSDQIYGMMLRDTNEGNYNVWATFRSADHTTVDTRPKLVVRSAIFSLNDDYILTWFADADCNWIGRWLKTPKYYPDNEYANATYKSTALAYVTNGATAWKNAGFDAEVNENYDIPVYFGNGATLAYAFGLDATEVGSYIGLCQYTGLSYSQDIVIRDMHRGGQLFTKEVYNITDARLFIIQDYISSDRVQGTVAHEIGHSLGYFGHAPSSGLMYNSSYGYTSPNAREINHLMIAQ